MRGLFRILDLEQTSFRNVMQNMIKQENRVE